MALDPQLVTHWGRLAEATATFNISSSEATDDLHLDVSVPADGARTTNTPHGPEIVAWFEEAVPALIGEVEDLRSLVSVFAKHVVAWSTVEGVPPMPSPLRAALKRAAEGR